MIKSILKSKTVWIAILQGLLGVIVAVGTSIPTVGWLLVAKSVLDIALRYITSDKVNWLGE